MHWLNSQKGRAATNCFYEQLISQHFFQLISCLVNKMLLKKCPSEFPKSQVFKILVFTTIDKPEDKNSLSPQIMKSTTSSQLMHSEMFGLFDWKIANYCLSIQSPIIFLFHTQQNKIKGKWSKTNFATSLTNPPTDNQKYFEETLFKNNWKCKFLKSNDQAPLNQKEDSTAKTESV